MKIEIEVPDIITAAKAINNAMAAYGNIVWSIILGCEVPKNFQSLANLDDDELTKRLDCLKGIYEQLEAIETKMKEV